jgi:hypothetical protein
VRTALELSQGFPVEAQARLGAELARELGAQQASGEPAGS